MFTALCYLHCCCWVGLGPNDFGF